MKIQPYFSSCWLHRQKYSRIFRYAGCTGKNTAAFFVMLTAPAKIQPYFSLSSQVKSYAVRDGLHFN
jgi:hypothetical protein